MEDIITLVGPRGAGKSTVGKELANKLGYEFISLDSVMMDELKSDGGIFGYANKYGWDKYILKLHHVLVPLLNGLKNKKCIIDLGGGTMAAPEFPVAELNAQFVERHTKIVLILPTENDDKNIKILLEREKERCKTLPGYYAIGMPDEILLDKVVKDYFNRVPILKKYARHHIYSNDLNSKQVADLIERTILSDQK